MDHYFNELYRGKSIIECFISNGIMQTIEQMSKDLPMDKIIDFIVKI